MIIVASVRAGYPDILTGEALSDSLRVYVPPVPEFLVERLVVQAPESVALLRPPSPAIILVIEGAGTIGSEST